MKQYIWEIKVFNILQALVWRSQVAIDAIEFFAIKLFAFNTMLPDMAMLASKHVSSS